MQIISNIITLPILRMILFHKNVIVKNPIELYILFAHAEIEVYVFCLFFSHNRNSHYQLIRKLESRKNCTWYLCLTNVAHFSIGNEIVKRTQSFGYRNEKSKHTIYYATHMTDTPSICHQFWLFFPITRQKKGFYISRICIYMCTYTLFLIYKINYSVKLILFLCIWNLFSYRKNLMIYLCN